MSRSCPKILVEDEETGAKKYRYVRTGGEDHFSLAFTYAWMAAQDRFLRCCPIAFIDVGPRYDPWNPWG